MPLPSIIYIPSSHQRTESPPWGLGHPEVIEDTGEDGALLSPVDLQGARPEDLHPVQVQRDGKVVGDLASHWHDAAWATLEKKRGEQI